METTKNINPPNPKPIIRVIPSMLPIRLAKVYFKKSFIFLVGVASLVINHLVLVNYRLRFKFVEFNPAVDCLS